MVKNILETLMSRITKNIISNIINFVISAIIPILLTPFIIHRLGNSHYGIWILINSVIGYYGLLDLGISSSVIRYVSKYTAIDDRENLNSFVNTALLVFLIVGISAIVLSGILALSPSGFFNLSEGDTVLFSRLMLFLGISFAISFPARVFNGILRAIQRYDITNIIDISCSLAQSGMTVYLLSQGGGLISLGLMTLGLKMVNALFSVLFALRKTPMLRINLKLAQKSKLRVIFGYSIFTFIWGISDRLRFQTDSIVIGYFISTVAITYYNIGARFMGYYVEAISAFCSVTNPIFSSMDAKDQVDNIRNLLIKGTRYLSIIAVFVGTSIILYLKPFIRLWIGEGYESSYNVALILTIPYIFATSQFVSLGAVYGIGKHKFLSIANLIEGIANLVLSIIFVRYYGIYGVAFGTAIPMLIMNLFIQPLYVCRKLGLLVSTYIRKGILSQLLIGVLYFAIFKILIRILHFPDTYFQIFLLAIIGLIFFTFLAFALCLNNDERKFWRSWFFNRIKLIIA